MKASINLATQPFRRDRPMLVGSTLVAALLVGLLGVLITISAMESGQLKDTYTEIARLHKRIAAVSAEQVRLDAVLRRPENAEVLERSLFLNALLSRKGISWTRIFADLEKVVPYNVRVVSIQPSANAQNQITLDMTVAAESPQPEIEFLKALQDSTLFGQVSWHGITPPSQNEPTFRCRVSVNYAQKL